jgi:hypothetical protein
LAVTTYRINPSTEELEVHVPGTGWAKAVVSVSSAGVEVGGGGGGGIGGAADVQYIDGDAAPTNPIGTAIVMASGGVMVDVSADNPMPVAATTLPLPTGAATDATLAALNAALGLVGDAIATAGGTGTASAKLRRMTQGLEDLKTLIVLATGTNVIGRVGIDQTTPGTTNLVQLPASQVTSLQNVIANAGTNLNTSTLALESGGNLAALLTSLGAAADAIVAAGAVGSASAKLRRMTQGLEDLKSLIVLATGTNVIGRVGIDQTTPGTTNLVQLPASQVTSLQNVTANAGTNLNTAALALESGGNLAALLTSLGAAADAIVAAGAVGSASAKLRRMTQGLEDLKSLIVLAAGANVIGKVGIDQAIPGTTNLVQLPSAQVTSLQTVTASAGTNLNTSALALESGGNVAAAAAVLGAVADAIVAAGGTGSVSAKLRRVTQGLKTSKPAGSSCWCQYHRQGGHRPDDTGYDKPGPIANIAGHKPPERDPDGFAARRVHGEYPRGVGGVSGGRIRAFPGGHGGSQPGAAHHPG